MGTFLFLLTFFSLVVCSILFCYFIFQKNKNRVKYTGLVAIGIVIWYLAVLLIVSLTSRQTLLPLNQEKCFDEWCAAIIRIEKINNDSRQIYAVTVKISNHARSRAQKPDHPKIYVIDNTGINYTQSQFDQTIYEKVFGQQMPIDSRILAQTSYITTLIYSVPKDKKGYVVISEGGFPTLLIIGDEGSLLHKKSSTPLK